MALKWYLVNRRQNLSLFLTFELALPTDFRVGQWIRNGGYVTLDLASLHFFGNPVHSSLCENVDDRDRAGTILEISFRLLLE